MFLSASQILSLFILPCKILFFAAKTTLNITFLIIKSIIKITRFLKARPAKRQYFVHHKKHKSLDRKFLKSADFLKTKINDFCVFFLRVSMGSLQKTEKIVR